MKVIRLESEEERSSSIRGARGGLTADLRNNFQSNPALKISITIAIENRSGKIAIRFSFVNRSAILISKSIPEFYFKIDQRLKTGFLNNTTDGA
jgi:hypothetical protein